MDEKEWVIQIDKELKSNDFSTIEKEEWKKHCIYKIPPSVTNLKKVAYQPQTVSFGPYHYGKEQCMAIENHKRLAFLHFLKSCEKPMELLFQSVAQVEKDLIDSYKPLDWKEGNHGFLRLMILDGCFMLEILRTADCVPSDYADDDPVFSDHGILNIMPFIRRDMLMLENQLPMMVLDRLIEFEASSTQDHTNDEEFLNKLIVKFFFPSSPLVRQLGKCLHVLDVCRKSLLQQEPSHQTIIPKPTKADKRRGVEIMGSARELREAGIKFKRSKSQSLKDASFNDGVLRLPSIIVDDRTESLFLNLMAVKRLHVGAGNEITSYIFFIGKIIDRDRDVAILHYRGLIVNALGNNKAVAKLFNLLSRDIVVDGQGALDKVQLSVSRYCRKPWNRWRADLIQAYFRNPWAIVSLVAAFGLFLLVTLQTLYTIMGYYKPH